MKKLICILLAIMMLMCLTACGNENWASAIITGRTFIFQMPFPAIVPPSSLGTTMTPALRFIQLNVVQCF